MKKAKLFCIWPILSNKLAMDKNLQTKLEWPY